MPERFLLGVLLLALAGCAAERPELAFTHASLVSGVAELDAGLRFRPSAAQLEALDHGIPLQLQLRVRGATSGLREYRLVLRHFPLSGRYQLHGLPDGDRSFLLRGYLLDALARLRLPLALDACVPPDACRVEARLDQASLPGALRLPALLEASWRTPVARFAVEAP